MTSVAHGEGGGGSPYTRYRAPLLGRVTSKLRILGSSPKVNDSPTSDGYHYLVPLSINYPFMIPIINDGISKEYNPFFWHVIAGLRLYAYLHPQLQM